MHRLHYLNAYAGHQLMQALNSALGDAQARGEYFSSFLARVGENGHSFHHGDEDCDEESGGQTPPPEIDDPRNDVVFAHRSTSRS